MYYLIQISIIFAVVVSNVSWHWTTNHYIPALIGICLAWSVTACLNFLRFGKSSLPQAKVVSSNDTAPLNEIDPHFAPPPRRELSLDPTESYQRQFLKPKIDPVDISADIEDYQKQFRQKPRF